jgi:hypothetical protein
MQQVLLGKFCSPLLVTNRRRCGFAYLASEQAARMQYDVLLDAFIRDMEQWMVSEIPEPPSPICNE